MVILLYHSTFVFLFSLEKSVTAIMKPMLLRINLPGATTTNTKSLDFGLCFRFCQEATSPYSHLHSAKKKTVIQKYYAAGWSDWTIREFWAKSHLQ